MEVLILTNINRKATKSDKKRAINELKKSHNARNFGVKGNLSGKEVHLILEYISQGGQLKRSTKTKAHHDEIKARKILRKPAKVADAMHALTPAINTLQNEYISGQKGLNIILQTLLDHGYTQKSLNNAAKKVNVKMKRGIHQEIKAFEKQYTSKHTGSAPKKSNKHSKVVNINSKDARHAASKIKRARNKKAGK